MEKQKLFFNKKNGNYGVYWSAKVTIDGKDYYISINDGVKTGQYGEYMGGNIQEAKKKEELGF